MKKKSLNHNGLVLNKSIVSSLESGTVKGGRTLSCFADADTNCGTPGTLGCPSAGCPSNDCGPVTTACPPSISCQPIGIC